METAENIPAFPSYKVAAIQTNPTFGDKAGNVKETLLRIEEAADKGAILMVLPEMCNTG
jgi:predicted amidohydrolase